MDGYFKVYGYTAMPPVAERDPEAAYFIRTANGYKLLMVADTAGKEIVELDLTDKEDKENKVTNLNSPDNTTYPTTQAVTGWATNNFVSTIPNSDNTQRANYGGDLNDLLGINQFHFNGKNAVNKPGFFPYGGVLYNHSISSGTTTQMALGWNASIGGDYFGYRTKNGGNWSDWYRVASQNWVNSRGFLTSETDPVYIADKPNIIFSGDSNSLLNNDAGYITSASIPTNYLTTNSTQISLTGDKTSTGVWQFAFRTSAWYKDSEGNERMYWGSGTTNNSSGFIFKFANANHAFQIRGLNNNIVSSTDAKGSTVKNSLTLTAFDLQSTSTKNLELGYSSTFGGVVQAYDRGNSVYLPLYLSGSDVKVRNLIGAGTRMVTAAPDGTLATQAIEVPEVGNGTLSINLNGATVGTFSANQSANNTIDLGNIANEIADVDQNYAGTVSHYAGFATLGGFATGVTIIDYNGSYSVVDTDHSVLFIGITGNNNYCYLPDPKTCPKGRLLLISNYSGEYPIYLNGLWSDGLASKQIPTSSTVYLQSAGLFWVVLMKTTNIL